MVNLMSKMEIRNFSAGEIIHRELDECLEILFVMEGKFDMGYEINKKITWRRQFGHSVEIGGFQLAYQKKHLFAIRARTDLHCYAIRRKPWYNLMREYPNYEKILNRKFLNFYLNKVHLRLKKLKQIDIDKYDKRRDFEQVLVVIDYNPQELNELVLNAHEASVSKTDREFIKYRT